VVNSTEKLYRIGQVAKLLDLPTYVLRFWETEFPELAPLKSPSGQRLYSSKDIETIRRIAKLRYDEKLTLSGAKQKINDSIPAVTDVEAVCQHGKLLTEIKNSLQDILTALRY
jgi:DNA-binding transcriptional MerR regulator